MVASWGSDAESVATAAQGQEEEEQKEKDDKGEGEEAKKKLISCLKATREPTEVKRKLGFNV